ncbi:DNA helicase [Theileria orientalis]|uniref:DNA 3'-5' helicase n=1 Tax=Theileria orientalis TaxID=68886 RepID=A0A976QXG7_THEOR|nr:DNA helicase [Theileria orientalis]
MDNKQFLSESTSFFALKKAINLINLISKYLSKNSAWSDVLKSQADVQQFIDYAVKSNFPDESLDSYKLNLPENPDSVQSHDISLDDTHGVIPLVNTSGFSNESYKFGSSQLCETYGHNYYTDNQLCYGSKFVDKDQLDLGGNIVSNNQDEYGTKFDNKDQTGYGVNFVDKGRLDISDISSRQNKLSLSSSLISTDYCSTEIGCPNDASVKETTDRDMPNLFETDEEEGDYESAAIPKVSDNLSSAREKYMNLINTNAIPRLDSSIPAQMFNSSFSYLFNEDFPFSKKVNEINRNVFGFESFRGVQLAAINSLLLGMDCFVLMATGVGKSHCYQLPSLLLNGTVVVFSPLLSLVDDQMHSLKAHGIEAQALNAKTSMPEYRAISKSLTDKHRKYMNGSILFITPEKFDKSKSVLTLLKTMYEMDRLKLFVIDEAHCVSQWGHSFRKDYRKLGNLKNNFPTVPILAVTATATPDVIVDITGVLKMRKCVTLITTINRPNLWLEVREKTKNYMDEVVQILMSTTGCGIVYCLTTSDCEKVAEKISSHGISVSVYHAKMDLEDRTRSQKLWKSGEVRIIVATVAFGMGIDKPDVRLILHTSAPTSILSYYQEIGRAGRDGKFSTTILWYSPRDFERHKNISEQKNTNSYNYSSEMRDFCSNRTTCRRKLILNAFGEDTNITSCLGCDNCCLNLSSKLLDVTEEATHILKFVSECMAHRSKGILTANILSDALRGSKKNLITKYRLDENQYHGALRSLSQKRIFEILVKMVKLKILKECRRRSMSFGRTVIIEGSNASKLLRGLMKVTITCYEDTNQPKNDSSTTCSESTQSQTSSKSKSNLKSKTTKTKSTSNSDTRSTETPTTTSRSDSKSNSKSKSNSTRKSSIITISELFTDEPTRSKRKRSEKGAQKNPKKKSKDDSLVKRDYNDDNYNNITVTNRFKSEPLENSKNDTMYKVMTDSMYGLNQDSLYRNKQYCIGDTVYELNHARDKNIYNNDHHKSNHLGEFVYYGYYIDKNNEVGGTTLKSRELIDLTGDSEVQAYSTCASNDEMMDNDKEEVNYSLFTQDLEGQSQREVTRSDIMALGKNNIRRTIPGGLFEPSQPLTWPETQER